MTKAQTGTSEFGEIHSALIRGFMEQGFCPTRTSLASALGLTLEETNGHLRALEAVHGAVLHPHAPDPWVVHPFSNTPTLNYVTQGVRGWWAPCIWCALGIAHLMGGDAVIYSRVGAETEPLVLEIKGGELVGHDNIVVHFAIPPKDAWNNVHAHCAYVLPFHSSGQVTTWCECHGIAEGEVVRVRNVQELARIWYGPYANRDWRKWTVEEAQGIFESAGLTSDFWRLSGEGTY